ncbi:MAG: universal stress protein [Chloroflexota bacterium]
MSKVLVPLDGSEHANRAIAHAAGLAGEGGELVLFHVRPAYGSPADVLAQIDRTADRLRGEGLNVEVVQYDLWVGDVGSVIAAAAGDRAVDAVVMASHGRTGLARAAFGSVADETVRRATVPVVVVPRGVGEAVPAGRPARMMVPLDGSPLSEHAVERAIELAKRLNASVVVVRCVDLPDAVPVPAAPYLGTTTLVSEAAEPVAATEHAQGYVDRMAARFRAEGIHADTLVLPHADSSALARVANEERADLIVMATHGRSGLTRLATGSTAAAVVLAATVPVMLIRPQPVGAAVEATPS